MKKYEVAVMALALAFVGVAKGQTPEQSQAYDRAMQNYQKFVGQFPTQDQIKVGDMKQYNEALVKFEQTFGQDIQRYTEALARFEQDTKTFEQALENFHKAERQYQKFLDSFPTK